MNIKKKGEIYMKGKLFFRRVALVLTLAMILSSTSVPSTTVEAKQAETKWIKDRKKGHTEVCTCPYCSLTFKVKAGKLFPEGKVPTKKELKKYLTVYWRGKKTNNWSVESSIVKWKKGGKFKVVIRRGNLRKKVSINVNRTMAIYIKSCKLLSVAEGKKFPTNQFKKKTRVMVEMKKGSDRAFSGYTVKAQKKKSNWKVTVSWKSGRTIKDTISIPIVATVKQPAPLPPPVSATVEPSSKPTETPTASPSADPTKTPTTTPSEAPTEAPSSSPSEAPTETPSSSPSAEPTKTPTTSPSPGPAPDIFANLTIVRNGQGNVTVNNHLCGFLDGNSSTEKITKGECTLVATNTSKYKFVRWVDTATNTELSSRPILKIDVNSDKTITAVFERVFTVTVHRSGGRGKVAFSEKLLEFYNNVATYTTVAGLYELAVVSTDDCNFVSITTNESDKPLSTIPTCTVPVTGDIELTVNFADAEKTVNVTYQHDNGQLLISQAVPFGESIGVPTRDLFRAGKTLKGWELDGIIYYGTSVDTEFYDTDGNSLSDRIKALTAQKQAVTIVSYYEDSPTRYGILRLPRSEHTSISYDGDVTKNEDGSYTIAQTSLISLSPIVPEGKFFAGWKYAEGADSEVISFDEEYIFVMPSSDISIEPIFSDTPVEKKPVVHFVGDYELFPEDSAVKFSIAAELPTGFSKTKWHMLYTGIQLNEEEMLLGSSQVASKEILSPGSTTTHWEYNLEMPESLWETGTTVVYFRLCLEYVSTMGSDKTYSKIIPITFKK